MNLIEVVLHAIDFSLQVVDHGLVGFLIVFFLLEEDEDFLRLLF